MTATCTCDHCGRDLTRMRIELRYEGPIKDVVYRINYGADDDLSGDFCDLPCLFGWASRMADRYGFRDRVPAVGSNKGKPG